MSAIFPYSTPKYNEQLENAVSGSEERLRQALATGGLLSWETDTRTGAISILGDARDIIGFEVPQDEMERLMHVYHEDADMVAKAMQHTFITKEPLLIEHRLIAASNDGPIWVRVSARFIDEYRLIGITQNIDAQKKAEMILRENEERQKFLLKLSDALRPLSDPGAIQETATRIVMDHFGSDRCYYCEIENGKAIIRHDAAAPGLPGVTGIYDMTSLPMLETVIKAGQPFIVHDVHVSDRMDESLRQLCIQLQVISFINIPVVKGGFPFGALCIMQSKPRLWTNYEIGLANEIAERICIAVECTCAENSLHESEARYRNEAARLRAILQSISDAVYIGDASGITLANQPALDQLGYSTYEELNKNIGTLSEEIQTRDTITNQIILPEHQAFTRALNGEHVIQSVQVKHRGTGKERILRSAASPVIVDGKIVAAVAINTDITEQWKTEAALRKTEEKYRHKLEQQVRERTAELQESHKLLESIYNTTHVGMSVFKPVYNNQNQITDFKIIMVNKRIADSSGRSDLPGKLYAKEFPGIKKMGLFDVMVEAMETGEPRHMEYFYEDLNKWYSTMYVRNNDALVCSNLDMTEQKQIEEENRQLALRQKELEEWQQQQIFRAVLDTQEEERKRIAESLHNSLGQLLYSVKLSLDQLNRKDIDDASLQVIRNTDKLLNTAIGESRRISHELMPVILEDFGLKTAIEDICRQFSDKIRFKCKFKGLANKLDKYAETAIYRIVQELIINVIKHSNATEATVITEISKTRVLVSVQDNGRGFNPNTGKGDGIGLKTIRNKVRLLNGDIKIVSGSDKGTRIDINMTVKN